MNIRINYIGILILLLIVISCKNQKEATISSTKAMNESISLEVAKASSSDAVIKNRMIIKQADIVFESKNSNETRKSISNIISELNAYVENENTENRSNKFEHRIKIRVPERQFDKAIERITDVSDKLISKNIHSDDVTEEFIDVEARIKTKKEIETRYKELLKLAKNIEEIMNLEREIGNYRTEIEAAEAQVKSMKDRINYSSITLRFYENEERVTGFGADLRDSFKNGWAMLIGLILAIVNLWPIILLAIGGIIVYRKYRVRNR